MATEAENRVLNESELADALIDLPGWELKGKPIAKTYEFNSFPLAVEFVNQVADLAEKHNHHPDIHINFKKVKVHCWTHKFNAITQADIDLAKDVEHVFEKH